MMKTGIGGEALRVIVLVAGQQLAQIVPVRMCIRVGGKIKRDTRGVVYTWHPTVMHRSSVPSTRQPEVKILFLEYFNQVILKMW